MTQYPEAFLCRELGMAVVNISLITDYDAGVHEGTEAVDALSVLEVFKQNAERIRSPLFGWGTLWQLAVMGMGGAVATPVIFTLFDWFQRGLTHARAAEPSFRPDREIRRGR